MIRFKPNPSPGGDEVAIRPFLDRERRRAHYKKTLKASQGADRFLLAADMALLDSLLARTKKVPTPLMDWEEVARLAGRVERQARKLKAANEVRSLERRLIKDGLATRVRERS